MSTPGGVVAERVCPHLNGGTKPVHVDVSVITQLLGKLRSKNDMQSSREVTQGIAEGKLLSIHRPVAIA